MRKIGICREKRALSNLIAYVLLISITLSLSVMVYGWLKFYVENEEDVVDCSSNVNIVISSYDCFSGADGNLTIVLKNKGLFNIDGFVLRAHNRTDAEFGFYVLEDNSFSDSSGILKPGHDFNRTYNFSDSDDNPDGLTDITLIDIQPYVFEGGQVFCKSYASQKVDCNP